MNKNDKILIVGNRGFVGNNLTNGLIHRGYNNLHTLNRYTCNLLDQRAVLSNVLAIKPTYVFLAAAKVGGINANMEDPYSFLYDNLMIQCNIINACVEIGVKKLMFLGSSCIYPKDFEKQPLKEEYLLQGPLEPTNEGYALSKITGLKLCEYANKYRGCKCISLMPANLYGPGDHYNSEHSHALAGLISRIYTAKLFNVPTLSVWGTGNARREWLYIDDLVDAMIWTMNNYNDTQFLNVGTGTDTSIKDLAEMIAQKFDYKGKLVFDTTKPDGMLRKCLDVTHINNLGWTSKTSLEDGLEKTINKYLEMKK